MDKDELYMEDDIERTPQWNSSFNKILSISGIDGIAILSSDGHIRSLKVKNGSLGSKQKEFFSRFLSKALRIVLKGDFGELTQVTVANSERKIIFQKDQRVHSYKVLFGNSKMNVGLAKYWASQV